MSSSLDNDVDLADAVYRQYTPGESARCLPDSRSLQSHGLLRVDFVEGFCSCCCSDGATTSADYDDAVSRRNDSFVIKQDMGGGFCETVCCPCVLIGKSYAHLEGKVQMLSEMQQDKMCWFSHLPSSCRTQG